MTDVLHAVVGAALTRQLGRAPTAEEIEAEIVALEDSAERSDTDPRAEEFETTREALRAALDDLVAVGLGVEVDEADLDHLDREVQLRADTVRAVIRELRRIGGAP